jgi:hypothetical protein
MPLTYNFKNTIIPQDDLHQDFDSPYVGEPAVRDLKVEYKAIVFLCMVTDMGCIKDLDHAEEFYYRANFYEKLFGPMFVHGKNKMNSFTAELDGVEREFVKVTVVESDTGEITDRLAGIGEFPPDIGNYPQLEEYDGLHVSYWFKDHDEAITLLEVEGAFGDDTLVFAPYRYRKGQTALDRDTVDECVGLYVNVLNKTRKEWFKRWTSNRELFPSTDPLAKKSK